VLKGEIVMEEKEQVLDIVGTEEKLGEYLEFLDDLRESGVTNMFGAGAYIRGAFDIARDEASKILTYWMHTFSERNPA